MSGHSKWSQIKRKKEAKDKAKGNVFSKLSQAITLAVIEGGGIVEPENNLKLRLAIEKAKQYNMPKENINRAIERGVKKETAKLREVIYEGFGPGGVALMIQTATDNPNRTLSKIKETLEKGGGKLGSQGSASYLFQKCGLVVFEKDKVGEETVFQLAEKLVAFDIDEDEKSFFVFFPFENLGYVKDYPAEIDFKPRVSVLIKDKEQAKKILQLVEALEQLDDVQKVFANFDIPNEYL